MKDREIKSQLDDLLKRSYWNTRYWNEIRRLHNIATEKQKPWLKKSISEAIAAKAVNPSHSRSYKRFLSQGSFKPYAMFTKALFQEHMEKELAEVLQLVLFSESSMSTGSRKAVELAMKVYPKAIRWNDPQHVHDLQEAVQVIESTDYTKASPDDLESLRKGLQTLIDCEPKTSVEIITIKAYSQLSRLQVQTQKTDLHDLASMAFDKACYLI